METRQASTGPRRTRERIIETSLRLFNDLGEPNVTTTTIAEEMDISPGNLYYHFRNKDDIINSIFAQFEIEMEKRLQLPQDHKPTLDEAWGYLQYMSDFLWMYRFLYRDINDLLARNRTLEIHFKRIVERKTRFAREICQIFAEDNEFVANEQETEAVCTNITVIATYWLNFQFVLNPRRYNDQSAIRTYLHAASYHILSAMAPYLRGKSRKLFDELAAEYLKNKAQNQADEIQAQRPL